MACNIASLHELSIQDLSMLTGEVLQVKYF